MNKEIQQRLVWIKLFEDTNDAGLVCRRCGISRPTLRKWWKRYSEQGIKGLASQSKRPLSSPNTKVNQHIEDLVLEMRSSRGQHRIRTIMYDKEFCRVLSPFNRHYRLERV